MHSAPCAHHIIARCMHQTWGYSLDAQHYTRCQVSCIACQLLRRPAHDPNLVSCLKRIQVLPAWGAAGDGARVAPSNFYCYFFPGFIFVSPAHACSGEGEQGHRVARVCAAAGGPAPPHTGSHAAGVPRHAPQPPAQTVARRRATRAQLAVVLARGKYREPPPSRPHLGREHTPPAALVRRRRCLSIAC